MKFSACSLVLLAALVPVVSPRALALSEDEAIAGRLIARRYADAIVGVKGTVVMRITVGERPMPPNEQKIDINGTMIAPSGLTVTSFSGIDPRAIFEAGRSQMNTGGLPVELGQTEFKALRLRLGDGTEIPVKVIGKDVERDLVFLAPVDSAAAKQRSLTFVDLNEAPASASILGSYYQLSRAGEILQRVPLIRSSTVAAIIERPRRLLIVTTDSFPDAIGCPVFDPKGRALGICLHFMENGLPKGTVLVPAADVAAAAGDIIVPQKITDSLGSG